MDNIKKIDPIILHSPRKGRPFSIDVSFRASNQPKPVVVHVHGFKGFKDWGYFNQAAQYFAENNFVFVKMNFSHNGVTPQSPSDFVDLEAFGNNNFSIEQSDLGYVIDYIFSGEFQVPSGELNLNHFFLTGHSRGGAAVILKAISDIRIKAIATWAGVNDLSNHFSPAELEEWEKNGVIYIKNVRTGQKMPLFFQLVKDYKANEKRFNVPEAIRGFSKPMLVVHGTRDETVPVEVTNKTKVWLPSAELFLVKDSDHVFGGTHPWEKDSMPNDARLVMDRTIEFFKRQISDG
jgi:dienelactone hydrolase